MPSLSDHHSQSTCKMILAGDSGSGKTSAFAPLIDAGYKMRILDFDNGLDTLPHLVTKKENLTNVDYITLTDKLKSGPNGPIPDGTPKAFTNALSLLDNWKGKTQDGTEFDLGKPSEWGQDTILVIDSGTFMSNAALRLAKQKSGSHLKTYTEQQDWGLAMEMFEGVLAMLYSEQISCHVIITFHIAPIGDGKDGKMYPASLGQKLPPKIMRYFNCSLLIDTVGQGTKMKRVVRTVPHRGFACKVPATLDAELPSDTALLTVFNSILKGDKK